MKRNTIKLVIKQKLNAWFATIEDEAVRKMAQDGAILTGGAIASMLSGDMPNDYDIYFRDIQTTEAVARYYVDKFNFTNGVLETAAGVQSSYNPSVRREARKNVKGIAEERVLIYMKSAGVASEEKTTEYAYFEMQDDDVAAEFIDSLRGTMAGSAGEVKEQLKKQKGPYRPVFFSENAISLSEKVQLVIRFYGEPDKIHDNYDYVHATCYYDYRDNKLELPADALEAIMSKTLVYNGSLYPLASIFRIRKFIQRGWRITAGQLLKIMWQISEIDLKNPAVLREQLIGVDQAYMRQLIWRLENADQQIDGAYIAKLIDEIFD